MIRDGRYLDREWVPEDLQHRDSEANALRSALNPLVDPSSWSAPEQVLIQGPSGSGKTALARYTLDRFREQAESPPAIYVNCWRQSTQFALLETVLDELGFAHELQRNVPHDEHRARIRQHHDPFVVVLDEVDRLEGDALLRDLIDHDEGILIAITTDEHWTASLDPRLQSRVTDLRPLNVDNYGTATLADILEPRAERALEGGVGPAADGGAVTMAGLRHIADEAAGNAHDGLAILRHAATEAGERGAEHITEAAIDAVVEDAQADVRHKRLEKLDDHPRAVWDVLDEAGEPLSSRVIHERYREAVRSPRGERQVRNYLDALADYNLVEDVGAGRSAGWRAVEPLS